jgi:hypothetical protein
LIVSVFVDDVLTDIIGDGLSAARALINTNVQLKTITKTAEKMMIFLDLFKLSIIALILFSEIHYTHLLDVETVLMVSI